MRAARGGGAPTPRARGARAVVDVVAAAFREHRTQWAPPWSELSPRALRAAIGTVHLLQAWPPRGPGAPRLVHPFEGLDRVDA